MRKYSDYYPVIKKEILSPGILKFTFEAPEIAGLARPGQFVQIRTSDDYFPLWPRPFSIYDADKPKGHFSIIFKIFGCGTSRLANTDTSDKVHILGPLGNGFDPPAGQNKLIMAAGGVGLPPLYFLSRVSVENGYPAEMITFISGARTKKELFEDGNLAGLNMKLITCTDDGSAGSKGTVVDILQSELADDPERTVYACGPGGMLKKIDMIIMAKRLRGYLSLEELMPCGYGICSGCAVKTRPAENRGSTDDNRDYHLKRVCVDGPVFNSGEVIWD